MEMTVNTLTKTFKGMAREKETDVDVKRAQHKSAQAQRVAGEEARAEPQIRGFTALGGVFKTFSDFGSDGLI